MELTIEQALQQGVAAHKEGKLQDAERLYRLMLQSHPNHPHANHNLGVLALASNQADEALPLFQTALKADSNIEQFWLSYIDALVKTNQLKIAKKTIKKAKKRGFDVNKLRALLTQSHSKTKSKEPSQEQLSTLLKHYQNGRYAEAAKLALLVTQEFPKHQFGWKVLGAVLEQAGRIRESLIASQKSVQLAPKDAVAHSNLGNTLRKLSRLDEAKASYKKAIALKPDFAEAHSNLGNTLTELGRLTEAEISHKRAIAVNPEFAEAYNNLGNTLKEQGKLTEAQVSYTQAIELKPDYAEAHSNLGNTLNELGRLDEAEASYTQAIALRPDYAKAYYNLGITLQELARLDEAEASYTRAIELKPDFAEAHTNLGNTLKELGRFSEAEVSHKQAIALKPDLAEAHSDLGITLFTKGDDIGSLKCFQKSCELKRGKNAFDDYTQGTVVGVSKVKVLHDIEQFEYLASRAIEKDYFLNLIAQYRKIRDETLWTSETLLTKVDPKFRTTLANGDKLIYRREAGRINQAINGSLDTDKICDKYSSHKFGLTYVDDFLTSEALGSLRKFLLESTIWFEQKAGGYLGAYLPDGLASPLILQIAFELKSRFPRIIKNHSLSQVWAYKYDSRSCDPNSDITGINIHADFAAVNVNFWVTQSEANLDPDSGGLVVYNTEAPKSWSFQRYNNDPENIQEELRKSDGGKVVIPHRGNRMVIFNSNLFHETDRYHFKEGYENRRINVTMLFGKREDNH